MMVTGGQLGMDETTPLFGFRPPAGTPYSLEVTTIEDFHTDHDDWPWNPPRPGRATFHYLILVTSGVLRHDVDHITRTVTPGRWLWVRPGHTQCWHPPADVTGPFILFEPDVLDTATARLLAPVTAHDAPAVLTPHPDDAPWAERTAHQLLDEHRALGRRPLDLHHALRRNLLQALLLRLAHSTGTPATPSPTTRRAALHQRFLDTLELRFRQLHHVDDYARLLGCSVRTLTRAAQDAGHDGARQVIDRRRLLEAHRLLGPAAWPAATVAAHLNFPDPADFGRFFRHHTGCTPAAWATQANNSDQVL